jgi:hypothetical protein
MNEMEIGILIPVMGARADDDPSLKLTGDFS